MKYLLAFGSFLIIASQPARSAGLPASLQVCEMSGDSFEWRQTNFSPAEWSLDCLNSPFVQIYEQDNNGALKLRTQLDKSGVQASFYVGNQPRADLAPEIKFFITAGSRCGDNLELHAAILARNQKKYVEKDTGLCTGVSRAKLEAGAKSAIVQLADKAGFEDYDHDTELLALTPFETDLISVRINYAKDKYEDLQGTNFKSLNYFSHTDLVGALPQHFNCGDVLTGAHYLPNSQKLLLNWVLNLSVVDYSDSKNLSEALVYRDPNSICVTVAYGFDGFSLFDNVFVSAKDKNILFVNALGSGTLTTTTFRY